jgi:hypothetical protein
MQPDLPESYYLDNVLTLFEHVTRVYADLLETRQLDFLDGFTALEPDARKLCIRLLNRSHDWYRRSKLQYPEIESLDAAIEALARQGFVEVNAGIDKPTLLSLFTMAELRALMPPQSGREKLRREELEAALLEQDDPAFFDRLENSDNLLRVLHRDEYQICQMLFFGNLNQSMTDFVLRDLGLYQFETYIIDPAHRPYRSTLEIQQHWLLYQLQTLFEQSDMSCPEALTALNGMIPDDIEPFAPAWRKSEQLRYEVARQLERIGELDAAIELYHFTSNACCRRAGNALRASMTSRDTIMRHSDTVSRSSINRLTKAKSSLPACSPSRCGGIDRTASHYASARDHRTRTRSAGPGRDRGGRILCSPRWQRQLLLRREQPVQRRAGPAAMGCHIRPATRRFLQFVSISPKRLLPA